VNVLLQSSRRKGFTLIELLVVIAIIAILIALLLPAVQQAREAARRTQCKNNLKQIGLALHNYHDNFNTFPPGGVSSTTGGAPYQGWGWNAMILPHMDQAPLYNLINFNTSMVANLALIPNPISTNIVALRCPSDVGTGQVTAVDVSATVGTAPTTNPSGGNAFGRSNYPGVVGYSRATTIAGNAPPVGLIAGNPPTSQNYSGIFGLNSKMGLRDMTDGSSNSVVVGERYTPNSSGGSVSEPVGHSVWIGTPNSNLDGLAATLGDTAVVATVPNATPANNALTTPAAGPGSFRINGNNNGIVTRGQTSGFGSLHTGGCHFLIGDGTVRFVSENIDTQTYRNLGTVNDGNTIGDF